MRLSFISVRSSCPVNVRFFLIDNFLLFQFCIRCRLSFTENQTSNLKTHTVLLRSDNALGTFMCLTKKKKNVSCLLDSVRLIAFGCVWDNCVRETFLFWPISVQFFHIQATRSNGSCIFFLAHDFNHFRLYYFVFCVNRRTLEALELFKNKIATPEGERSVFFFYFCRWITNHSRHFFLNC